MTAKHQHPEACQSHTNQDPCFRRQPPDVGAPATWNDSHPGDVGTHAKASLGTLPTRTPQAEGGGEIWALQGMRGGYLPRKWLPCSQRAP